MHFERAKFQKKNVHFELRFLWSREQNDLYSPVRAAEPIKVGVKTSENLQEQSGGHGGTDLAFKRQIHEYALV